MTTTYAPLDALVEEVRSTYDLDAANRFYLVQVRPVGLLAYAELVSNSYYPSRFMLDGEVWDSYSSLELLSQSGCYTAAALLPDCIAAACDLPDRRSAEAFKSSTAAAIATLRAEIKVLHREMWAISPMGSPDWTQKKDRLFSLSVQLQEAYDLEAGATILTVALPEHFDSREKAERVGRREVARLQKRGTEVRAWRILEVIKQFSCLGQEEGEASFDLDPPQPCYRVEVDEVVKISDLFDAGD